MRARKPADENEVLRFYTDLLRMEGDAKITDATKAAEFFVKYYGMLEREKQDDTRRVVIVDDIAKVREESND